MAKKAKPVESTNVIKAYKGFDLNMQCRGMQYKLGETQVHKGDVKACESGLHSCENPLDVFEYYAPGGSIYAEVEASGQIARHSGDSKVASAKLHVKAVLSLPDYIARAFEWVRDHCTADGSNHATGNSSASSATGNRSASSATGNRSASSATGNRSASSATGDSSASSATGNRSASSATGDSSASSATGDRSASSATGDRSASSATGYRSASLAIGWYSSSEIKPDADSKPLHAVAIATGYQCKARAPTGSAIVLVERNDDAEIVSIRASKVGENGVEPDVWYTLKSGEFVKAEVES